jgi:hypothetical protein
MAVLADGRIQLEGAPAELIAKTRGRIWMKTIERAEPETCRETCQLISTRLCAGRTVVHVLSDTDPRTAAARSAGQRSTSPSRSACSPPIRAAPASGAAT